MMLQITLMWYLSGFDWINFTEEELADNLFSFNTGGAISNVHGSQKDFATEESLNL